MLKYIENEGWELYTNKDLKAGYYDRDTDDTYTKEQVLALPVIKNKEFFNVIRVITND